MGHAFLSDSWFDEVKKLRDATDIEVPAALKDLVINLQILGSPNGDISARLEAGSLEKGHADLAPTKLKIPYDVARKMIIEEDQAAAMQAFMSGQIQVEGDMAKLMQMQTAGAPSAESLKVQELVKEMTD